MKLERIRAENYKSWQAMDLPIAGMGRIVTVSGHNGAGKTSMAESWAVLLYETAPSKGKGIAKYVRNVKSWGDKDVVAEMKKKKQLPVLKMEGFFTQAGFRYRIVRTFDPNLKQNNHMLAVMKKPENVAGEGWEESDGAISINEQTIPDTQAMIERLIGNYRAFITSTFMSGGIGGLLDCTDDEREEAAAFLFGCEGYDKRLELAQEKRLALERAIEQQAGNMDELKARAGERETHEASLLKLDEELSLLNASILELETKIADRQKKKDVALQTLTQAESALKAVSQAKTRILALETQHRELTQLVQNHDDIRAQVEKLKTARVVIRDQHERYDRASAAKNEITRLNEKIVGEKLRLESTIAQLEQRLKVVRDSVFALESNKARLENIEPEIVKGTGIDDRIEAIRNRIKELNVEEAEHKNIARGIISEQEDLLASIKLIKEASGCCPTCERAFDDESGRQKVVDKLTSHMEELRIKKVGELELATNVAKTAAEENASLSQAVLEQNQKRKLENEKALLLQAIAQAEKDEIEQDRLEREIDTHREAVATSTYAAADREALLARQQEAATIGFDQDAYAAALQEERDLAGVELAVARLEKADSDIETIQRQIETERANLETVEAQAEGAEQAQEDVRGLAGQIQQIQTELGFKRGGRETAAGDRRIAKDRLDVAIAATAEIEAINAGVADQRKRLAVYKVLEGAFAPRGIPNMKYSRYLPVLSNKVNFALAVISPGWQISITSQINNRGKFTIPIEVTSPEGLTDSYNAHSGGERFIIALSFLIGQGLFWGERTGAQPQQIEMDEGFGVLDPANMEKAKAAISATATNFGQVIIVSHIPELQSMGQVQLTVYRTAGEGSVYEMVGSGTGRPARISKHYLFEEDQYQAINSGVSILKEAIPGMTDEKAIELSVAEAAQATASKPKAKRKK